MRASSITRVPGRGRSLRQRPAPGRRRRRRGRPRELESLDALPASVRLTVAAVLHRAGATEDAETSTGSPWTPPPTNARARTSLGELLLARGAWAAAAEVAGAVPADDPYLGLAARIELCGLIGRGTSDQVQAAQARAADAGLSTAELERVPDLGGDRGRGH